MPGDANSSQWHRISWPLSGVAGGTPAGGGVCPTGLFPAGVPTGWPHPSADALCPIPAGLGVASGFPVARLLLCSVSPSPPLSAVPSNPFSAAPSESAAGRCWPRLAPAGTRPPRSCPGACASFLPLRRQAALGAASRGTMGTGAEPGGPLGFAPARYPRTERGPEGQCGLAQRQEGRLCGPRPAPAAWPWREGGRTPGGKGGRCVRKAVPRANQGRRLKGGRVPRTRLGGRSPARRSSLRREDRGQPMGHHAPPPRSPGMLLDAGGHLPPQMRVPSMR